LESVVLTVARPRPAAFAISPAVIALPLASAARTALFVAPGAVRALAPLPLAFSAFPRFAELVDADDVVERPGFGAAGARRRELGVSELSFVESLLPSLGSGRELADSGGERVVLKLSPQVRHVRGFLGRGPGS
jgi:hypothetical protein